MSTNLLSGLLAFVLLEGLVRTIATHRAGGITVGSVLLRPTWRETLARSRELFPAASELRDHRAFFNYDPELGWTVGANRRSADGLYFSSHEGLRSPGPDLRFANLHRPYRVALVGDLHAFSFEVPFEAFWGFYLQKQIGENIQVLNFGVDGYGIDQAYLRYLRDVRPWKPQVVIIGFSGHDLRRSMAVYPFLSFGWPGYLVKPRFDLASGALRQINAPLPSPESILNAEQPGQLPFVEHDLGYLREDWHWQWEHRPLFLRFLTSVFPRWPLADDRVSVQADTALNSRLFAEWARSIADAGSVALFVLMSGGNSLVKDSLPRAGLSYLDASECVKGIPEDRLKVPPANHHYTGETNQAIALCTALAILRALENSRKSTSRL